MEPTEHPCTQYWHARRGATHSVRQRQPSASEATASATGAAPPFLCTLAGGAHDETAGAAPRTCCDWPSGPPRGDSLTSGPPRGDSLTSSRFRAGAFRAGASRGDSDVVGRDAPREEARDDPHIGALLSIADGDLSTPVPAAVSPRPGCSPVSAVDLPLRCRGVCSPESRSVTRAQDGWPRTLRATGPGTGDPDQERLLRERPNELGDESEATRLRKESWFESELRESGRCRRRCLDSAGPLLREYLGGAIASSIGFFMAPSRATRTWTRSPSFMPDDSMVSVKRSILRLNSIRGEYSGTYSASASSRRRSVTVMFEWIGSSSTCPVPTRAVMVSSSPLPPVGGGIDARADATAVGRVGEILSLHEFAREPSLEPSLEPCLEHSLEPCLDPSLELTRERKEPSLELSLLELALEALLDSAWAGGATRGGGVGPQSSEGVGPIGADRLPTTAPIDAALRLPWSNRGAAARRPEQRPP
eukprot:CAMPEP_0206156166 /NCGR_PEP_ID=MMETSP1474-20131121/2756_1 /ASSEMBLY_ACC=CAM_ASM_001110 /TAXON_ID=97495 /ORGANISM="Imantonia sp., Strain RCC918" /LENGTH=475 /DNA_ID=CAMNT_0053555127 /DNA_START=171 /DNA_END=1594 /DNA_ORIENTATION=-